MLTPGGVSQRSRSARPAGLELGDVCIWRWNWEMCVSRGGERKRPPFVSFLSLQAGVVVDLVWGRGPGARGGGPGAVRWRMGAGAGPMEISRVIPRLGPGFTPARPPQPGEFPFASESRAV